MKSNENLSADPAEVTENISEETVDPLVHPYPPLLPRMPPEVDIQLTLVNLMEY